MTKKYDPQEIETKWQQRWEETGINNPTETSDLPKWYFLTMLPYPSGDLHIGHWYAMAPSDAAARFKRMQGHNVIFPIGFDAFGLPAENAAIKNNIHPMKWTLANIARMRGQLQRMGAMWSREHEAVTCDPEYYKWTQWFFLRLYEAGLAYRAPGTVDFCPHCNTTLAREQVWGEDRHCERCGTPVIKKDLEQWYFRITNYADELLDFSKLQWPERVETLQRNWIGRSEGARVVFKTETGDEIEVFTTRPDTLWGATFMVLAPEHKLVDKLTTNAQRDAVETYKFQTSRQSEMDRTKRDKEKTGVFTGSYAINPVNGERIPIWIADYVLMTYGAGAIMAVPAHDERDFAFAHKFGLEIRRVISGPDGDESPLTEPYESKTEGVLVNSGPFNGTPVNGAAAKVASWLAENGIGHSAVNYRLRDWLISRQRMWGAPIPIIYCEKCGTVPVPYENLPVRLPDDAEFLPTGESPLKYHKGFRYVSCPQCGGPAERETDTMDTFMCSSWYQYAYITPYHKRGEMIHRDDLPWEKTTGDYWLPVDQYTGGIEHATMHLLYTRFFTKALRDLGVVSFDEPMLRLFNQGTILGEDGEKMSKSRGNVVAPDEWVNQYGADVIRAFLMFIGPWDMGGPWNSRGIEGILRFAQRVWGIVFATPPTQPAAGDTAALKRKMHQTIKKVTENISAFKFNTMLASLMEFNNYLIKVKDTDVFGSDAWQEATRSLILLLAPIMPHISEELWEQTGGAYSVHTQRWPTWDDALAQDEMITLVVQINGKVRERIDVAADIDEAAAQTAALSSEKVVRWLEGKPVRKVIYAPKKLINIVV